MAELRSFIFLSRLQPQTMCYLGTWIRGSLPRSHVAAQVIEVAPGLDIEPLTDVAVKHADVRAGILVVERQFGYLEIHGPPAQVRAAAAAVLAAFSGAPIPGGFRYSLIVVLGITMGIQNAAARKLAVADLTTTVLTMTITGVAADSSLASGPGSKAGRRLIAVAAMLVGAVIGAALVLNGRVVYPLVIALIVTAVAAATSQVLAGSSARWLRAEH